MEIVQATAAHIEELVRLRLDFYKDIGHPINPDSGLDESLREYYTRALADGSFAAWFIEEDGRAVSTVFALPHQTIPGRRLPSGKKCTVTNVFTYPEYRGRGHAKALMRHIVEYARQQGIELLELFATKAGAEVYRPLGFAEFADPYMSIDLRKKGSHE